MAAGWRRTTCISWDALDSSKPVSYTHLDVYKRQAVITDTFDPILNITGVTFNGTAWTSPEDYTYDAATGDDLDVGAAGVTDGLQSANGGLVVHEMCIRDRLSPVPGRAW